MQNTFIELLPPWVETGLQPAFYDKESGTVLQQTARMYAKVNEALELLNHFGERLDEYENFIYNLNLHDYVAEVLKEYVDDGTFYELLDYDVETQSLKLTFDMARS